jgi:hypothetical protein
MEDRSMSKSERCRTTLIETTCWAIVGLLVCGVQQALAQESPQRLSRETNQSSQRYEINQTFGGQAFFKDNNIWAVDMEFADLFGMPQQFVDDLQGVAAAAFRIEDTSYQDCGYGGKADACRKVEECVLDLYFDETKNPLPWATDIQMQWYPKNSSMRWLRPLDVRKERPHGTMAVEPPPGIIRNKGKNSIFIPFADPVSKVEATFTSNTFDATAGPETPSNGMFLLGYMRDFYRNLSVVSLQLGCGTFSRSTINVRLDSRRSGDYEPPVARFNRVLLPERFVQRIKDTQKVQRDRNAAFYRSLFAPPLGTKGTQTNESASQ